MVESGYELQDVVSQRAAEAAHLVRLFILMPLILILLPPLIELVLLLSATVGLQSSSNHLAEMAAVGASPLTIKSEMASVHSGVNVTSLQLTVLRQPDCDTHGAAARWDTLSMVAGQNDAQPGERLQVRLCYDHRLLFGSLFARVFGASSDGCIPIEAAAESVRE